VSDGINLIVYPANDLSAAKQLYSRLFNAEPYADSAYYVGYRVGSIEFGLDPNAASRGITGPVAYWPVDDIHKSLEQLLAAGAQALQDVSDVGGGKLIALVKDSAGNIVGLAQK
jgi:predicted enzyme related to lactoylglutathione lyase